MILSDRDLFQKFPKKRSLHYEEKFDHAEIIKNALDISIFHSRIVDFFEESMD